MTTTERERDHLGRLVRIAWIKWAKTQPDPKPSWLVPYEQLAERDKEADRQIGETIAAMFREDIERLAWENRKLMDTIERMAERRSKETP